MLESNGREWWKQGTVNVTNGSNVVTGTDTDWKDAGVNKGDMFTLDDQTFYEIENVATNTSLTLVKAFRGTTASGQSYGIPRNYSIHLAADALALYHRHIHVQEEVLGVLAPGDVV